MAPPATRHEQAELVESLAVRLKGVSDSAFDLRRASPASRALHNLALRTSLVLDEALGDDGDGGTALSVAPAGLQVRGW